MRVVSAVSHAHFLLQLAALVPLGVGLLQLSSPSYDDHALIGSTARASHPFVLFSLLTVFLKIYKFLDIRLVIMHSIIY
jgi:hypothetical protein